MTVIFIIYMGIRFRTLNFNKIQQLFLIDIWRFNNFKMAAVRHLGFSKFALCIKYLAFHFILQKFAEIRLLFAELCPKTIFNMADIKNGKFWSRDCHGVHCLL